MTTPNEELILKLRGQAYTTCRPDQLCDQAADLLQSQAEHIKELELLVKVKNKPICDYQELIAERDTLRAELADAELHTKQVERGLDKATAQLAAIAATEPVATLVVEWVFHEYDNSAKEDRAGYVSTSFHRTAAAEKMPIGKYALFTRPMPAQDVNAELVEALEMALKLNSFREFNDHIPAMRTALSKYKGAK